MADSVCRAVNEDFFPLILSGDHATAGATITGLKMANREQRLGVIWIDAHADIHSPYTSDSGNMHGMPLNIVLGEDNVECKKTMLMKSPKQSGKL
jgi:arginase